MKKIDSIPEEKLYKLLEEFNCTTVVLVHKQDEKPVTTSNLNQKPP